MERKVATPAQLHLFNVNENANKLQGRQKEVFHSVTQKLLYVAKWVQPDIETLLSFLTMRVTKSDTDDWEKLRRGLIFIKNTINDKKIIGAKTLSELYTWIDSAYAVHPNIKGHTGGGIPMGYGVVHCKGSKQKINVKSSTEAELVGVSEYIPYNLWMWCF